MGSTYNSGEDIVTTPAVSDVDERSDLGMMASHCYHKRETQVRPHSEFITLISMIGQWLTSQAVPFIIGGDFQVEPKQLVDRGWVLRRR